MICKDILEAMKLAKSFYFLRCNATNPIETLMEGGFHSISNGIASILMI
jgi:hypothetical protein